MNITCSSGLHVNSCMLTETSLFAETLPSQTKHFIQNGTKSASNAGTGESTGLPLPSTTAGNGVLLKALHAGRQPGQLLVQGPVSQGPVSQPRLLQRLGACGLGPAPRPTADPSLPVSRGQDPCEQLRPGLVSHLS